MGELPLKLMIVDDNARFRSLVRNILTQPSDEIIELEDGSQVNETYSRFQPDWILMDIRMPHVDGIEATRRLLAQRPCARVIILSDHTDERLVQKSLATGAMTHISKEDVFAVKQFIHAHPIETEVDHV